MPFHRQTRLSTAKGVLVTSSSMVDALAKGRLKGRTLRSHTRAKKGDLPTRSPAGVLVYGCRELLERILSLCDWKVLMIFGRLETYSRTIVQYLVRQLIKDVVLEWVSNGNDFLEMLQITGGGITGSVARKLLATNSDAWRVVMYDNSPVRCSDLNLVIPRGRIPEALTFLKRFGYDLVHSVAPSAPWTASVLRFVTCTKVTEGGLPNRTVTLSESTSSLMEVVVSSPITAQANLITASRVYCVYPHLITHFAGLRTDTPRLRHARRLNHPYTVIVAGGFKHYLPCGRSCTASQRKTLGDKGIASFVFDPSVWVPPSRSADSDYLLCQAVVVWKLSARCTNRLCRNWTPCEPPVGIRF